MRFEIWTLIKEKIKLRLRMIDKSINKLPESAG